MDESGVLELSAEEGVNLNYWHVMDSGKDSVDLLAKLLDHFGERLQYVLALNQLRGDDFSILQASGQQEKALALGARVVSIKRLNEAAIQKIDATSSSFWAASNAPDKATTGLGLMERQRVKLWLRGVYQQLDAAGV